MCVSVQPFVSGFFYNGVDALDQAGVIAQASYHPQSLQIFASGEKLVIGINRVSSLDRVLVLTSVFPGIVIDHCHHLY